MKISEVFFGASLGLTLAAVTKPVVDLVKELPTETGEKVLFAVAATGIALVAARMMREPYLR